MGSKNKLKRERIRFKKKCFRKKEEGKPWINEYQIPVRRPLAGDPAGPSASSMRLPTERRCRHESLTCYEAGPGLALPTAWPSLVSLPLLSASNHTGLWFLKGLFVLLASGLPSMLLPLLECSSPRQCPLILLVLQIQLKHYFFKIGRAHV